MQSVASYPESVWVWYHVNKRPPCANARQTTREDTLEHSAVTQVYEMNKEITVEKDKRTVGNAIRAYADLR